MSSYLATDVAITTPEISTLSYSNFKDTLKNIQKGLNITSHVLTVAGNVTTFFDPEHNLVDAAITGAGTLLGTDTAQNLLGQQIDDGATLGVDGVALLTSGAEVLANGGDNPFADAGLTALAGPEDFNFTGNFGNDTVVGFNDAQDAIRLSHTLVGSFATIQADTTSNDGGALITFSGSQSIFFAGISPGTLIPANFHIV